MTARRTHALCVKPSTAFHAIGRRGICVATAKRRTPRPLATPRREMRFPRCRAWSISASRPRRRVQLSPGAKREAEPLPRRRAGSRKEVCLAGGRGSGAQTPMATGFSVVGTGMLTVSLVPRCGLDQTLKLPPIASTRSPMLISPSPDAPLPRRRIPRRRRQRSGRDGGTCCRSGARRLSWPDCA